MESRLPEHLDSDGLGGNRDHSESIDDRSLWGKQDHFAGSGEMVSRSDDSDRHDEPLPPVDWGYAWSILRPVFIVWSFVVWLTITVPQSLGNIHDLNTFISYSPLIGISLTLLLASTIANKEKNYIFMGWLLLIANVIAGINYEFK